MSGPLEGITVLDMSRVLAGPWAGQLLADLGARVIKVEHPERGDDTRGWGPPWLAEESERDRVAAYYLCANRGKHSLAVDIASEEGQALVRRLAEGADILLENFKVGGLAKYGLDYASLHTLNPRLIGCSITGFGQDGPYAHRAGYDFMIQAMGGLMSLTGEADGLPMKTGVAITDVMTGLYATVGVLAALQERERTGVGRHVDVALLDVQVATLANQALNVLVSGQSPERHGNAHPNIVPYQAFACADGYLALTVGNDTQFGRLAALLERPEWARDPAYATNAARVGNREVLVSMIQAILVTRSRDEWLTELEARGIPAGPINTLSEVFEDPQVQHREMYRTLKRGELEVPQVANPLRFDGASATSELAPPRLGQDSDALLSEMGLTADDIVRLRKAGVVR
ncbi:MULTISPECIES: CaiB/BaiF CoA-transferase family protein [unclassified Halomonas]|uniref:CaiB/BaiF CoA transferase family protein n=1 Tax=unclassified Halomonas TaxID=2609666 RepID=UPI002886CD94|nr:MULTISPECIES: CaiB/BaiF CoA-transferase family protein [unclassified Halomonas]MDT0499480.1 CaiB/BaiF CoA-transferase family protein [Halomonas sp. PAR7]MDT0510703.1 CaiB/BaiF CoA-transferase family protein [Halomonas sp. LES1]MDT0592284.1 CaiB/BaiF CoA-transferase family protein [Halomonas sp. PAR8]